MPLRTIGSLWVGEELSWLEQLCLKSFLDHGHNVVLFTYGDVKGIPDGVCQEGANTILPADNIIRHAKTGSPAYHADIFRLHMLKKTDYIWADTDAFCCQPWKPKTKHFHGWISAEKPLVNNGVLGLPKNSKTLAAMLKFTSDEYPIPPWYSPEKQARLQRAKDDGEGVHVSLLPWGVWGPDALTWFLKATGEIKWSQPGHVIYPIPFKKTGMALNARRVEEAHALVREDTLSIHFWGRRFRSIAAKFNGLPPAGCYVEKLLQQHDIDPMQTSHLLTQGSEGSAEDHEELDFTMFSDADVVNIILQRAEIASDASQGIRDWISGNDAPLLKYAQVNRERLLQEGVDVALRECRFFFAATDQIAPKRIADIGCGYAFAGLHLHRRYGSHIVLIDIEAGNDRHFGFEKKHPGYTSLTKAREFLEKNGVPSDQITTINPNQNKVDELGVFDLIISLASCGFHYPVETYETMFSQQINDGGGIVLDIRKGSGGIGKMKQFGTVDVLAKHPKYSTVISQKRRGND